MPATTNAVIQYRLSESPVGGLLAAADARALRTILFLGPKRPDRSGAGVRKALSAAIDLDPAAAVEEGGSIVDRTIQQLNQYFSGKRREFDLPLAPAGTAFQRLVWDALLRIRHGETWTYAELARAIGKPAASRAVGAANGANPIPIVIPCHRVIGADGSLTGYGGGVGIKRALLELEGWSLFGSTVQARP
jgi:O-6-methylguanine DNA methyltransferase